MAYSKLFSFILAIYILSSCSTEKRCTPSKGLKIYNDLSSGAQIGYFDTIYAGKIKIDCNAFQNNP